MCGRVVQASDPLLYAVVDVARFRPSRARRHSLERGILSAYIGVCPVPIPSMQDATLPHSQIVIERLRRLVESPRFTAFITAVILFNAVTLGMETWPRAMEVAGRLLVAIDRIVLAIFVFEMIAKLLVYRLSFFRSGWNIFDLTIVGVALIPAAGPLTVLRALRILRVLRLLSVVPQMRSVVAALIGAIPGMGSIAAVMSLIFYVGSVLATGLFGAAFPDWFGSIGASAYSLFQIMIWRAGRWASCGP